MSLKNALTSIPAAALAMALFAWSLPLTANAQEMAFGLVGSWTIAGQPDGPSPGFVNVFTSGRDGTMINTDPLFGTGHGVWSRTGKRTYAVRFVTLTSPFNPVFPDTVITVIGQLRLDPSGQTAAGTFETTFTDLNGNPIIPPAGGTISATRINLN